MHRRDRQRHLARCRVLLLHCVDHHRHRPFAVRVLHRDEQIEHLRRHRARAPNILAGPRLERVEATGAVEAEPVAQRLDRDARPGASPGCSTTSRPSPSDARRACGRRRVQVATSPRSARNGTGRPSRRARCVRLSSSCLLRGLLRGGARRDYGAGAGGSGPVDCWNDGCALVSLRGTPINPRGAERCPRWRVQIPRSSTSTWFVPRRSRKEVTVGAQPSKRAGTSPMIVASSSWIERTRRRSHLNAVVSVTAFASAAGRTRSAASSRLRADSAIATVSSISSSNPGVRDA